MRSFIIGIVTTFLLSSLPAVLNGADDDLAAWAELSLGELRRAMADADDASQARFYRWLPGSGRIGLYPILIDGLEDRNPIVVESALRALAKSRSQLLVDHLQRVRSLAEDPRARVREVAAIVLGRLGDDRALDYLIPLLDDEQRVARAAHQALTIITRTDHGLDRAAWEEWFQDWIIVEDEVIPQLIAAYEEDGLRKDKVRILHKLLQFKAHRHSVGEFLAELIDTEEDPTILNLAMDGTRNLSGVAALKSPKTRSRAASGQILASVSEYDSGTPHTAPPGPAEFTDHEQDQAGTAGRIITWLVILGSLGLGAFYLSRTPQRSETSRKHSQDDRRQPPERKRRITFTR